VLFRSVEIGTERKHVTTYLADFLFPTQRAKSPVKMLSGGERNRLLLARLFARPANFIVLDEPTNDLDIETLELLEELIGEFDGTVLLVSHDRAFLDRIVTSTLAFEGQGRVVEYIGGYADYDRQRSSAMQDVESVPRAARRPAPVDRRREPAARKLSFNDRRELESLPARIEALEKEQQRLKGEIEAPEFYKSPPEHIHGMLARLTAIAGEIDAAVARWLELEDRA